MDESTRATGTSGRRNPQGPRRILAVPAVLLLIVALTVGAASVPAGTVAGTPRTATHRQAELVAASLPCVLTSFQVVGGVSTAVTSSDSCSTSESGSILTLTFTDVSPPVPACPFQWLQTAHPACTPYISATGSYTDSGGNKVISTPSLTCPFSAPGQPEPSQFSFLLPWFVYGGTSYTCTVEVDLANLGADTTLHVDTDDQVLNADNSVQYDTINNFSLALVSSATPPLAGLNYHPTGSTADQFVFDGSPSIPAAGASIVSYAWDFGDGTTTSTAATTVTHQYAAEGDRTVTLTVTDSNGLTGSTSTTITPSIRVEQVTEDPVAPERPGVAFSTQVTIENDGTTTVNGVVPTATIDNTAVAQIAGGPTPPSVTIPPGLTQTFNFPALGVTDGQATITSGASGATSGGAAVTAVSRTAALVVGNPGLLVDVTGEQVQAGQNFNVKVTLTDPGVDPVTNLAFADPTGVANETVVPAGATTAPPAVATLVSGPNPALPTEVDPGHPVAITYLFNAGNDGSAVFTTSVTGTTKAADGSDKTVAGQNAVSLTVTNPIIGARTIDQAAQLAFDQADQILTAGSGNISDIVANGAATQLGLPAPTEAQSEAARQIGLPQALGAIVDNPGDLAQVADGFGQAVTTAGAADVATFGKAAVAVFDKARDPATYLAMGSAAYQALQKLPAAVLQSQITLAQNDGYLAQAALSSLNPANAVQGLSDTVTAGQNLATDLQAGITGIEDQVTAKGVALAGEERTNRAQYLHDVGGLLGTGSYQLGKVGVTAAIGGAATEAGGAAFMSVAGRVGVASMESTAAATDGTVAADAAASVATDTAALGSEASAARLANIDGAVSAFQQRSVDSSITIAEAASEGGILPSDSRKVQTIIGNVKTKYKFDVEIGVRTSEPLSVGLDVSPKIELIKPKAVSVTDLVMGAPSDAAGTATVFKPVELTADQVANYDALQPGFASTYQARYEAQLGLFKDYQDPSSTLRVLIDGSAKYPDGITAIAGRPTTLGSYIMPSNLKYLEQLDDPAYLSANGLSDSYAAGLKSQLQSSYPDLVKVNIQAVDRGNGAVSFYDGLANRFYGSDLDVQYVRPANGAPWPAGQRGQIETDINYQFKQLSRFPGHGWSDAATDLSTQYFGAAAKFIMSESDPALAQATASSLQARYQLAASILDRQSAILTNQAAAATDPTAKLLLTQQAAAFQKQAAAFRATTLQDILNYGSGNKLLKFTAGDIRVGYSPPVGGASTTSVMRRSGAVRGTVLAASFRPVSAASVAPTASMTLTVDDPTDRGTVGTGSCESGGSGCTLREALAEAAQTLAPVTVDLPAGTYALTAGAIPVTGNVSVVGAGATTTTVDGGGAGGLFTASGGSLTITGTTLTGGLLVDPGDGTGVGEGAAIAAQGSDVTLVDSVLTTDQTDGDGGAVSLDGGSLTATGTTFSADFAGGDGGAVDATNATVTLTDCTFSGDGASGRGGAVSVTDAPALTVGGSTFSDDTAMVDGGGLSVVGAGITSDGTAGPLNVTGSTFTSDLASQQGGAIAARSLVSPQGQQSVLAVSGGGFTGDQAPSGGAIAGDDAPLSVTGATFNADVATEDGGGAIISSGPLTVSGATLSGDSAAGNGGAVEAGGAATIDTSTFTGDVAGGLGGALALVGPQATSVTATSVGTDTATDGGADVWRDGGDLTLDATTPVALLQTLAGQTVTDAVVTPTPPVSPVPTPPVSPVPTPPVSPVPPVATSASGGYRLVGSDGGVFAHGTASFLGSEGGVKLNRPVVATVSTPDGGGYWLVASDGGVFAFGDAGYHGSTGGLSLDKPIVGMAATADGGGYWLVASDGGVFAFGDARYLGSESGAELNQPIVGMAATPDGGGYWLVGADGGIFTFGDARFYGSTGALSLNGPVVGMAATPDGGGYWLVGADGGIFTFGDARFYGSTGALSLNRPVVEMATAPDGGGYWLVASDGGVFAFGDAPYLGSQGGTRLAAPIVGVAPTGGA